MSRVEKAEALEKRGVIIPALSDVFVGDEVDLNRIAAGSVLHPGCRLKGERLSIGPNCEIGAEGPVVLDNCQLGRGVKLKGGYFTGAVFFDGANMGSGAHIRAGSILEEEANGAHTVGLKQTVLLPFVTLGSLINFCDVLMAGGTSRKDHSEVGSSYIHFNFTPHQDKATASLVGDVPNGVFMDQQPIFLGGQGGLVGPARIAFGSVVAAGGVCRQSIEEEDQLHIPIIPTACTRSYDTGAYRRIAKIVEYNLVYIGNIAALKAWYQSVRAKLMHRDEFDVCCLEGGIRNLDVILQERIKRLGDLAGKMAYSIELLRKANAHESEIRAQQAFADSWPQMKERLCEGAFVGDATAREQFLAGVGDGDYIDAIKGLSPKCRDLGRKWLQSVVDEVLALK